MLMRCCWLALLGFPLVWARLSLVENGYQGVVVAISPEEEENPNLVQSIKDLLTKASGELYGASRQRAYFKSVTILVPQTWNLDEAEAAEDETYDNAEFRVAPSNPAFGHNPYTVQVKYSKSANEFTLLCRIGNAESLEITPISRPGSS